MSSISIQPSPNSVLAQLLRKNASVEYGGSLSRLTSDTAGRVLGLPNLILSNSAMGQAAGPEKLEATKQMLERMRKAGPDSLDRLKIRLGGTNIVDDLIYRSGEEESALPWHKRIGGRVWQNPRTSPIGKLLGTLTTPINNVSTSLMRGSHYNPYTDTAVSFFPSDAVTSHEIGHAIDFNSLGGQPGKSRLKNLGKGLLRDAYALAYRPGLQLWHEAQANIKSRRAIDEAYKDDPEAHRKLLEERLKVLPAGYGSYIGNLASPVMPVAPLIGAIAGRAAGQSASQLQRESDTYSDGWGRSVPKKNKSESGEKDKGKSEKSEKKDGGDDKEQKKEAANLHLGDVPQGTGPQQMHHALQQFERAKALVRPSDEKLKATGLSRDNFNDTVEQLAERPGERYNLRELASNPGSKARLLGLLGALAGGGAGYGAGGLTGAIGGSVLGGLGGAGFGYYSGKNYNDRLYRTANLLREYGLLRPEYLRRAQPLLS